MEKLEQFEQAINSIEDFPDFFKQIQQDIAKQSKRLHYLLYGKDNKYEGPLYNGLQSTEWTMILLLVSNWIIEVVYLIKPKQYEHIFDYQITTVACKILLALIQSDIISLSQEEKIIVLTLLQNQEIINFVNDQIELVLTKVKKCCGCFQKRQNFVKISNKIGNKCTFINSVKSLKLP